MDTHSKDVATIIGEALEIASPAERESYLENVCGGDAVLRRHVDQLLDDHARAGDFLEKPAVQIAATVDLPQITERPGTVIGPYKLLEQIGEGGFGIVFMADQQAPVRRRVALKIIKPGMDTRQVLARFKAEQQALALMDHPNIARALDAGATDSGRPYFVMELVRGVPITDYCDQNNLPVHQRLDLFFQVCHAVQHAHQKGIIHRDIKPSNVLITVNDGRPVPKVIDFGVAKAINQQLTQETVFTRFAEMIGTPLYMSPEQAEMTSLDIDTRSDIYSLGVLLYELLTGTTPFDKKRLKNAAYDEIRRIIREEEPAKPSTRISTLGDKGAAVAAHRHADPHRLSQLVRGDLDWIVMKALEKDRTRRYETANGLAMEVQRYLADEPVLACPPSAAYRLRKFARRNRVAFATALVVLAAILLGTVVSVTQAIRATRAERLAEERLQTETEARKDADAARQNEADQRRAAEAQRAEAEKMRHRAEASFRMARDAVDRLFTQVGQSSQLKAHAMERFRKDLLQNAKEFYERFIREQFDAPGVRYDLGLAYHRLAEIQRELGDYSAAEDSSAKAIATLADLSQAQPDRAEYQRALAASHTALGFLYYSTARRPKADAAYQQALAIQQKQAATNPEAREQRYALAKTYSALGLVRDLDRPESAVTMCQQAQDILSKLVQDYPNVAEYQSLLAATQMNLGEVYLVKGWYAKAETAFKEAQSIYGRFAGRMDVLPEDRESLARSHTLLGTAYAGRTRIEKAEEEQQQALRIFEALAQEHPDILEYAYNVGRCHLEMARTAKRGARPEVALKEYAKAIETMEQVLAKGYPRARLQLLNARIGRAGALAAQGDHSGAAEEAEAAVRQPDLLSADVYNAGCVFSRASAAVDRDAKLSPAERLRLKAHYAERAMDSLRQAIAKGVRNPSVLKEDRDLDPLRARGDFQKLLADLQASSGNN